MRRRMVTTAWSGLSGIVQSKSMANVIILLLLQKREKMVAFTGAIKFRMAQVATSILCQMMVLFIFQITHSAIQMK